MRTITSLRQKSRHVFPGSAGRRRVAKSSAYAEVAVVSKDNTRPSNAFVNIAAASSSRGQRPSTMIARPDRISASVIAVVKSNSSSNRAADAGASSQTGCLVSRTNTVTQRSAARGQAPAVAVQGRRRPMPRNERGCVPRDLAPVNAGVPWSAPSEGCAGLQPPWNGRVVPRGCASAPSPPRRDFGWSGLPWLRISCAVACGH
jgi:hypothetical protein